MQAAKHILCYLVGTTDLEILYRKAAGDLTIFADAAYANARKLRSTTGYCALITDGAVTWTSHHQAITAQSTTKSKYIALADTVKQTI